MSGNALKIAEGLRKLSGATRIGAGKTIIGVVQSTQNEKTATVTVDGLDIPDVLLMVVESGAEQSFLVVPKDGSNVLVSTTDDGVRHIVSVEIAERIYLKAKGKSIDLSEIIKINGDSEGGLVKSSEVADSINAVIDKVNQILQVLMSISVLLAPSGTYPFAPLFASVQPLSPVQPNKFENTNVKHG